MPFCYINSHNRFKPLERHLAVKGGSNLRELRLNSCQLTWNQVSPLLAVFGTYYLTTSSLQFLAMHCLYMAFTYEPLALYSGSHGSTRIPFTSKP